MKIKIWYHKYLLFKFIYLAMKIQIFATVIIFLVLASCMKDNDFGQRGTITGLDYSTMSIVVADGLLI